MNDWIPKYPWQPKFLEELAAGFMPRSAARKAGISRSLAYLRRDEDPEFAALWKAAVDESLDDDEEELMRRGRDGDTTALLARLRAYRQPYRDGASAGAAQIIIPPIIYQERAPS